MKEKDRVKIERGDREEEDDKHSVSLQGTEYTTRST